MRMDQPPEIWIKMHCSIWLYDEKSGSSPSEGNYFIVHGFNNIYASGLSIGVEMNMHHK